MGVYRDDRRLYYTCSDNENRICSKIKTNTDNIAIKPRGNRTGHLASTHRRAVIVYTSTY